MARIVRPGPPAPVPVTPPPAVVTDAPDAITPAGAIKTKMPDGATLSIGWDAITRYDAIIHREADPVGWPIERVRGHIVIESNGSPKALQKNASNGWSYGLMQVVPFGVGWAGWHVLVRQKAGLGPNASAEQVVDALYKPEVNIAVGVAILESLYQQYGTLDKASSAFFLGNPYWDGQDTVNGNTGDAYKRSLIGLITEQRGFAPAPPPEPTDLFGAIFAGAAYSVLSEFAVASDNGLYGYGVGHGLNGSQHTGVDLAADPGTPLYTPIDGVVVCAGTGVGSGAHGSSCAAFNDYMGRKTGRVEVMTHDGAASLIFGHSSRTTVSVGQTVTAGEQVATVGGMFSWHCHLEARTWVNGDYMIRDPREVFAGGSGVVRYAPRVPIPQPADFDVFAKVVATTDGVPVLQRADLNAAEVRKPLAKGEDFEAVYQVIGNDGAIYWVTSLGSRVPVIGTRSDDWRVA